MTGHSPELICPDELVAILGSSSPKDLLILDLRVFAQYSKQRVKGALNLCIPTTLLKRASYGVTKLAETFTDRQDDEEKFRSWTDVQIIIAYDAASSTLAQAASCVQILNKFTNESFQGALYVLKGGLNALAKLHPNQLDERSVSEMKRNDGRKLSIDPSASGSLGGGCAMPAENAVKPFFNTIRQNMDLIGGVGQFPIRRPAALSKTQIERLPVWLRKASDPKDEGKMVADRFLAIEKAEQQRMQKALSDTSYQRQGSASPHSFRIAGIEKGVKNRYKDILPFERTRVRLGRENTDSCDYVNASHVKPKTTSTHFIACQAPVPATFQDFWRVVWEQDARVIMMLTAEAEEGHLKAHPYWTSGDYGPFRVNLVHEEDQTLHYKPDLKVQRITSMPVKQPVANPQPPLLNRRHTSNPSASHIKSSGYAPATSPVSEDAPVVSMRRITLTNTSDLSHPTRELHQVQFPSWPDTGTTARPKDILALVDLCDSLETFHHSQSQAQRPCVVHCSAGCGRTGAFCTVANVKRMLLKQIAHRPQQTQHGTQHRPPPLSSDGGMDINDEGWIRDEEVDLIAQTVSEFRLHRMSMVQTLRQFVLCYEAIMELFVHDDWMQENEPPGTRTGPDEPSKLSAATRAKRPGMGKRALSGV